MCAQMYVHGCVCGSVSHFVICCPKLERLRYFHKGKGEQSDKIGADFDVHSGHLLCTEELWKMQDS